MECCPASIGVYTVRGMLLIVAVALAMLLPITHHRILHSTLNGSFRLSRTPHTIIHHSTIFFDA